MNREKYELVLGTVLLIIGIVVVMFVFVFAYGFIPTAGNYLKEQLPETETVEGPTSRFNWNSNDLSVNFEDVSDTGDADIVSWEWTFGDGESDGSPSPTHSYPHNQTWTVYLIVEDDNGKKSQSSSEVNVEIGQQFNGNSEDNSFDFDMGNFSGIILPLALAIILVGLFFVMAVVGGYLMKAGWNLIKPRPETIKVRVKPKDLEVEPVYEAPVQPNQGYRLAEPPPQAPPQQMPPEEGPPPPPQE
jgi:hypothetical protein